MGFFSTITKAATSVASKVLSEVLVPLVGESQGTKGFRSIYTTGPVCWGVNNGEPYVKLVSTEGDPVGISFTKSFTEGGKNRLTSKYIQLDFDKDKCNVRDLLVEFNDTNCSITIAPEDVSEEAYPIRAASLQGSDNKLKRLSTSAPQVALNDTIKVVDGLTATFFEQDGRQGILLVSEYKATHFSVNIQAIFESDISFASYHVDEDPSPSFSGTKVFVPFPDGTFIPNDFISNLFIEVTSDSETHLLLTKNVIRGIQ